MSRAHPERELYRLLQQQDLLDSKGRVSPEAFSKARLLAHGKPGLSKTRLATDVLGMMGSEIVTSGRACGEGTGNAGPDDRCAVPIGSGK